LEELKHPYILPVLDAGLHEGLLFLVVEYAVNGTLRDRLQGQPFQIGEALTILAQIAQALQYAYNHDKVHRDLKPENILFNANGEALLADFGIAVTLERTQQIEVEGSPSYMAPEQFLGEISKRSDQYALGCIAYELLTGRRPFVAPTFLAMGYKACL
jgi:serine/threonine protein kinase